MNDLMKNVCEILGFDKTNSTVKRLPDGSIVVTMKSNKDALSQNSDEIMKLLHEIFDGGVQQEVCHGVDEKLKAAQEQTTKACIEQRKAFQNWLNNFDNQFITELVGSFQGTELRELNDAIMENTTDSIKLEQAVTQVKHRAKELARKKLATLENQMKQYASYLDKD